MSEHQGNNVVAGFLIGAVVGAGVALLVAPASGSETRRRIKEKALELKDSAAHKLDHMGHAVSGGAKHLSNAVKAGREEFRRASDESTMHS